MSDDRIDRAVAEMLRAFEDDEGFLGANYVNPDGDTVVLDGEWDLRKVAQRLADAGLLATQSDVRKRARIEAYVESLGLNDKSGAEE